MYEPKFKEGDVIIPNKDVINTFAQLNNQFIRIMEIERINNTFYYVFNGDFYKFNGFAQRPLFPAMEIDRVYTLDNIYLRKEKLNKIIYKNEKR